MTNSGPWGGIERARPYLEVELEDGPKECLVHLRGDLLAETSGGLWSVESILVNEAAVVIDLSGVTSVDGAGLESVLILMNAVQASGRSLSFGKGQCGYGQRKCLSSADACNPHLRRLSCR